MLKLTITCSSDRNKSDSYHDTVYCSEYVLYISTYAICISYAFYVC